MRIGQKTNLFAISLNYSLYRTTNNHSHIHYHKLTQANTRTHAHICKSLSTLTHIHEKNHLRKHTNQSYPPLIYSIRCLSLTYPLGQFFRTKKISSLSRRSRLVDCFNLIPSNLHLIHKLLPLFSLSKH